MTIDDIYILRDASQLIKEHVHSAQIEAIKLATKMLDAGDVDGYAVWKRIVDAIKDTQRETPHPGEQEH